MPCVDITQPCKGGLVHCFSTASYERIDLQELSFRGHDESESSLNKGNYVEFLKL